MQNYYLFYEFNLCFLTSMIEFLHSYINLKDIIKISFFDIRRSCEYNGFWAQDPLLNTPSTCMSPSTDSNPNMAQNSLLHKNHTGTNQMGKTYIPSEAPSPLTGRPTAYRIFIHGSLNISI